MILEDELCSLNCSIRLNRKTTVEESGNNFVFVSNVNNRILLPPDFSAFKPLLYEINQAPVLVSVMIDKITDYSSLVMLPLFYKLIEFLDEKGLITYCIQDVLDISPLPGYTSKKSITVESKADCRLSRFSFIRYIDDCIRIETPLNAVVVQIYDFALLERLFNPGIDLNKEDDVNNIQAALKLLYIFCFIQDAADENNNLKQWEFHDLLLHARSRYGRHKDGYGATYRFLNLIDPLPPVKEPPNNAVMVVLDKPDIEAVNNAAPSFFYVIEKRYSARTFEHKPLALEELSKLLYLTLRVKSYGFDTFHEITKRPYPSGGSIYELEVYITSLNCDGLANGMYYYNPANHILYSVSPITEPIQKMVFYAEEASKCKEIQVLLTISARFQRVFWKYEAIGYSLILKNTGVLLQNLSLAATAMNVGSCIIGSGASDALSEVLGKKFYEEAAVGEMILGSI